VAAFASYLNLSAILVGASDGPESALEKAAAQGQGWAFAEIRAALEIARGDASVKHWDALGQLGEDIDVRELREFAAAMSSTATAASLPETLRARADNLMNKVMSSIEGEAETATDRMSMPMMLLVFGLMVYVMYGALFSTFGAGEIGL
jgi:tight adherence protein C